MVVSAKGTRLNRRGLQTRLHMIDVAIRCLAAPPEGEQVSANLVAREAGVTWGTVQHQFGDADGLWAAVLEHILTEWQPVHAATGDPEPLASRIDAIVTRFWRSLAAPQARAVGNLRQLLPGNRSELELAFPHSAAAIAAWDRAWTEAYAGALAGLDVDEEKLHRVRIFLPGALRGMRAESELSTYFDIDEGRRGMVEAIVAYLS
ncbi:TetR/AcrR family transcriptional regulator [Aldersonia sp. NBC_00410]|uniref:TetR/AcrR family transcriptional regulator n=1 Tax=Aldersonia sp. NBC_00410 TaxID=2975954 RepID=UPI00225AA9B9|nr:TetR/AcrR family transcriptional regulator [Aldersonia sp. NBC_00410]MCX5044772.1 TetR/AcrR family transcriptional regulator [Aldersonia sp. NBC_00410]